jgi:cysteine desulfurase family protein (TIGR01976 family)
VNTAAQLVGDRARANIASAGTITTDKIRDQFPALTRAQNGHPVAFFDGPGGTQVPTTVVEAMSEYLYHHNANTHWVYPTSEETDEMIASARRAVADFLNSSPNEVIFGANMTSLTFHLSRSLSRRYQDGDEIVITELDHHGNVAPWQRLERECGVKVRSARMIAETGELDWEHLAQQLNKRTRLVAIGAASNALGTINDIPRAFEMARATGAQLFVDAVHYAPHRLIDVQHWKCDYLSCSAYKFYGPHIGILYARSELLELLDFPKLIPAPDVGPERAEPGTQNHEGIVGAAASVDFLAALSSSRNRRAGLATTFHELDNRGAELTDLLWNGLAGIPGVRLYGPPPSRPRTATVAFTVSHVPSIEVARCLARKGVFVSHGDFYAATVIHRLGLTDDGVVRAGCACYTTKEEIERLLAGVEEIAGV